jgi:hypothetical protein
MIDYLTDAEFELELAKNDYIILEKEGDIALIASEGNANFKLYFLERADGKWMLDCSFTISKEHVKVLAAKMNKGA